MQEWLGKDGTFIAGSHKDLINAQLVPVVHISDCRNLPYAPIFSSIHNPDKHSSSAFCPSETQQTAPSATFHNPDKHSSSAFCPLA